MTLHQQTDSITLSIGGTDITCQVSSGFEFEPGGYPAGDTIELACEDTRTITEPGQWANGYMRGDLLVDTTTSTGFVRTLIAARLAGTALPYVFTSWKTGQELTFTGNFRVAAAPIKFNRIGATSRIAVDLTLDGKPALT